MTVVKPSTITSQVGAYNYKSGISSPSSNYIDNQFPNLLDKANGDSITGTVTVAGSGSLEFLSGSTLLLDTGSGLNLSGLMTVSPPGFIELGGTSGLIVDSTASITVNGTENVNSGGSLVIKSGATFQTNSGSTTILNGKIFSNIVFDTTNVNPLISQIGNSASDGYSLTLQAQSTTHNGSNGGNLLLLAGVASGTSSAGGNVIITAGNGVSSAGSITLNSGFSLLATLGAAGLQLGESSITIASGTNSLTASQYALPWLKLSSSALAGNATVALPSGLGPAIFVVAIDSVSFNGHTVAFRAGGVGSFNGPVSNTSNTKFLWAIESDNTNTLIGI